jgi:apolipoprotein N-acyltransferase
LQDYVAMSQHDRPADTKMVLWGESAVAFFLDRDAAHRRIAATAAPPDGFLIAGADHAQSADVIFNSLYVIKPDGDIVGLYDKSHLVPFGEFMPFRSLIPFNKLTEGGDFSSGPGLVTMEIASLPPFSPLICFEAIFPGHVVARAAPRPDWLLNLTNDSWFGTATGPYQHFATARLRSIEEGLPLVRVADTGISAVVDSVGRVMGTIGLDRRGVLDAPLPAPLPPTLFSIFGNLLPLAAAGATALVARRLYRRT